MIGFNANSAQALLWVAAGAASKDPENYLLFKPGNQEYIVSTNTASHIRSIRVSATSEDGGVLHGGAVKAKAILSVASKVDEESSLGITIKENEVLCSCGSTSMTLVNFYNQVMDNTKSHTMDKVVTVNPYDVIGASVSAVRASKDGVVFLQGRGDNEFYLNSGSETVRTQELFLSSNLSDFDIPVASSSLKTLGSLKKIEFNEVSVSECAGAAEMTFKLSGAGDTVKELTYTFPTFIGATTLENNPCDEDIHMGITAPKKTIVSAIKHISGAVEKDAVVSFHATNGKNYMTVKVSGSDGSAKSTVVDAKVNSSVDISAPVGSVLSAFGSLSGVSVSISTVTTDDDKNWMVVSPIFKEDAESEDSNSDIVIAVFSGDK